MSQLSIYKLIKEQKNNFDILKLNQNKKFISKCIPLLPEEILYIINQSSFITFNNSHSLILNFYNFCVKIIFFRSECNYSEKNPNSEIEIMKKLLRFIVERKTPHINISFIYSYCNNFVKYIKKINLKSYLKINREIDKNQLEDKGLIIISDWYEHQNLTNYLRKNILNELEWKLILFKIIFTLSVIQDCYPNFRHNDLNANNILIKKTENKNNNIYKYGDNIYTIPDVGYELYINDFEYSNISNDVINKEIYSEMSNEYGIRNNQNRYYDIHYFLNSIYHLYRLPSSVNNFIKKYIPEKYLAEDNKNIIQYRLIKDEEIILPNILLKDKLFSEFININIIGDKYNFN